MNCERFVDVCLIYNCGSFMLYFLCTTVIFYAVYLIHNFFHKPPQPSHERKKTKVNTITFLFPVVWKYLGNNSERKENVTDTTCFRIN
jgi:hypothetical protein